MATKNNKTLRNSDISKTLGVSKQTPANWIKQTLNGNIDLILSTIKGKNYIVDSNHNWTIMTSLKNKGYKYISSDSVEITFDSSQQTVFSNQQIIQLYSSLSSKREIPYKFTYLSEGAELWDLHYGYGSQGGNAFIKKDAELINNNVVPLLGRIDNYENVNIFDIGCGNAQPVISIINALKARNIEVTYTAIDISKEMIDIAKGNVLESFPDIKFEEIVTDIDFFNISENIFKSNLNDNKSLNLLLYLGGTFSNQSDESRTYSNLRDSMAEDDLLIISGGINDFPTQNNVYKPNKYHLDRTLWIPRFLGLGDYFDPETIFNEYDPINKVINRFVEINTDVALKFVILNSEKIINLKRGDKILILEYYIHTLTEVISSLEKNGFLPRQVITNKEGENALFLVQPRNLA